MHFPDYNAEFIPQTLSTHGINSVLHTRFAKIDKEPKLLVFGVRPSTVSETVVHRPPNIIIMQIKEQSKVYDAIIVGSGAGGGMATNILANAGFKVAFILK